MQVLRHRLTDPSGNPVAGHTANVMEYETPEEAFYRGYRRVPIVTATSDDSGWLTWILPRSVSNVYAVSGIEPLPIIVTIPYGVPSVTVSEARTGIVTGGGVRAPATVDLVTELELATKLAGLTRDLVGELVADPAFLTELANNPDLLADLTARPELGGTPDDTPNTLVRRSADGAAAIGSLFIGTQNQPGHAVRKDYVDGLGTYNNVAGAVMRRDPTGQTWIGHLFIAETVDTPDSATRKDYVDGRIDGRIDAQQITDWNTALVTGTYYSSTGASLNTPEDGKLYLGQVQGIGDAADSPLWVTQTVHEFNSDGEPDTKTWRRSSGDSGGGVRTWSTWYRLRLGEAEQNAVLGATGPESSTIVRRDGSGWMAAKGFYIESQVDVAYAATRKDYVDGQIATTGSDQNIPGALVRRDASGGFWGDRVYVNQAPVNPYDATRKDYVDGIGTDAPTANTVVRRDVNAGAAFGWLQASLPPTQAADVTRKDYVDGIGTDAPTANTVVRRGPTGYAEFTSLGLAGQWSVGDATRKDYVDSGDTAAKSRVNHTGTQAAATISDLTENVQDIVDALIAAGTGLTKTYDDVTGLLTLTVTNSGGTTDPEIVRDVIGGALVQGSGIIVTVNDAGDTITIASSAVLPTRQVISGTGLTGGGDLSADRTLSVVYGTAAGTAAQGNDTRITGAVPNTRSVISGTGLAGGGTLAADRTLTVSYGSAAGTAVQGNDTRVTADQAAATASIRTLGTGATQAAAGNHTHTGMVTGTGITDIQKVTQAAYDAIVTKSTTTLYVIQG